MSETKAPYAAGNDRAARLAAIRARCEESTAGPWYYQWGAGFIRAGAAVIAQTWDKFEQDYPNPYANGTLMAHSREDVKWLLDQLAAAEAVADDRSGNDPDEEIERWQTASGLVCGGDPGGVTPEMLGDYIGRLQRVAAAAEAITAPLMALRDALAALPGEEG